MPGYKFANSKNYVGESRYKSRTQIAKENCDSMMTKKTIYD